MYHKLEKYIRRYINLNTEQFEVFTSYLNPVSLTKKQFILEEGQVCNTRYYVKEGCLRMFYIDEKGNEQIIHFGVENWWITDYESLLNSQSSKYYIQATENTILFELPNDNFEKLCIKLPETERLFRKVMERSFIAAQKRLEYTFSLSGEELFHHFINNNKAFTQKVPQYMIASYLGMSPEFVSKVKHKN